MNLNWLRRLIGKENVRREVRLLPWNEADALIRADKAWRIAPEEDHNRDFNHVWIERLHADGGVAK